MVPKSAPTGCLAARVPSPKKVCHSFLDALFKCSINLNFTIVIVEALIQGYKDGMDILTLSLGGADGWAASSSAVVSSRMANLGKIVTIAAGNDVRAPFFSFFFPFSPLTVSLNFYLGRIGFLVFFKPRKRPRCHFGCQC